MTNVANNYIQHTLHCSRLLQLCVTLSDHLGRGFVILAQVLQVDAVVVAAAVAVAAVVVVVVAIACEFWLLSPFTICVVGAPVITCTQSI